MSVCLSAMLLSTTLMLRVGHIGLVNSELFTTDQVVKSQRISQKLYNYRQSQWSWTLQYCNQNGCKDVFVHVQTPNCILWPAIQSHCQSCSAPRCAVAMAGPRLWNSL